MQEVVVYIYALYKIWEPGDIVQDIQSWIRGQKELPETRHDLCHGVKTSILVRE